MLNLTKQIFVFNNNYCINEGLESPPPQLSASLKKIKYNKYLKTKDSDGCYVSVCRNSKSSEKLLEDCKKAASKTIL